MKNLNEPNPMSPEDFEKRLKQSPLRPAPAEWRSEILAAAKAAAKEAATERPRISVWKLFTGWLAAGLELRPQALAGLAAIWVVILALHFSTHEDSSLAANGTPVPNQVMAEVREQRLFFAELVGLKEPHDAEPP